MHKKIEVMKQLTELLQTMEEALTHVHTKLKEGEFEVTSSIFVDIIQSFSAIEGSVNSLPKEFVPKKNAELTDKLRNAFDITVSYYESGNYAKITEVMQFTLIPSFNRWKSELDKSFGKYLVS